MTVKSIMAFVQPHEARKMPAALSYALALGAASAARVVVLSYLVDVVGPGADAAEDGRSEEEQLADAKAAIQAQSDKLGVSCEVVDRSNFAYGIGEVFADHLKVADVGVLHAGLGPYSGERLLVNAALFESGRPVILVPEAKAGGLPRRVLVAWDGTPASARAMHEALPILALAGEAIVARVSNDKILRMDQSGIEAAHHLARHGIRATFRDVPRESRDVLRALTDTARDTGCDMIVCGALRHSTAHDLLFGSVTQAVLSGGSDVPVFMTS